MKQSTFRAPMCLAALTCVAACGGEDSTTVDARLGQETRPVRPGPLADAPGAEDEQTPVTAPPVSAGAPIESDHTRTVPQSDGSFASQVDATSMADWVYFSLRSKAEVTPADPEHSDEWDVGFQRSNVKVNGGISGAGNVSVSALQEPFDAVSTPPADGYLEDAEDADLDGSPDYAFAAGDGWYDYDPAAHTLSARDTVFVVKTGGGYFKLQFSSYYDPAGTPAKPQFRWAPLGSS
jgi:predicted small lipoprotein YifL